MEHILETMMLVCFGLSWPISLVKNIKAKSAKSMSLGFTLLIIAGYIAGISAKIMSGAFNYVLAAYFINLAIVSANVVVYFINRSYDRKAEKAEKTNSKASVKLSSKEEARTAA